MSRQGELRNNHQLAANIQQREIHMSLLVPKYPVVEGFIEQLFRVCGRVAFLDTQQQQKTRTDAAAGFAVSKDVR